MKKKGAVELSITTIVVIIIGLAILGYGLVWVKGLFQQFTVISDEAIKQAQAELKNQMGSNQNFYLSATDITVRRGEEEQIVAGIRNIESSSKSVSITTTYAGSGTNPGIIQISPNSQNIGKDEVYPFFVIVNTKDKNVEVGKTYPYIAEGKVGSTVIDRIPFTVKIT